jgi:hypothetical protein
MLIYTDCHPAGGTITVNFREGMHMTVSASRHETTRRVVAAYLGVWNMDREPFPYDDARLEAVLTASHCAVLEVTVSQFDLHLRYALPITMFSIPNISTTRFCFEEALQRSPAALTVARTVSRGMPYQGDSESEEEDQDAEEEDQDAQEQDQ